MTLIALIIRHSIAAAGGWFAANNITGDTTASIIIGLLMLAFPVIWSWVEKAMKLDEASAYGPSLNSALRALLGAVVSQLVTAMSTYFAVDANNPELLGVAVLNAGASQLGWHQRAAFLGSKNALKLLLLCGCMLALASCSTFSQHDAKRVGSQIGLAAADTAIILARMQLAAAESELQLAASQPGADQRMLLAKKLGVIAARRALDEAERAIARQRARLDAKQPRAVTWSGNDSSPLNLPRCLMIPAYGNRVATHLASE